MSTKTNICSV